jgi:hypothetical protein
MNALRELSAQKRKSMSDLAPESVDAMLREQARQSAVQRALASVGKFSSGRSDISVSHDEYLAEAYEERENDGLRR